MKTKLLTRVLPVLITGFCLFILSPKSFSAGNILAKVGDQTITKADMDNELAGPVTSVDTIGVDPKVARQKVLDEMIDKKVLSLEADAEKITPNPKTVDDLYQKEVIMYGGEDKFKKQLKNIGLNEKQYRQQKVDELRIYELLFRNVYSMVKTLTIEEVQAYYNSHKTDFTTSDRVQIRHIFFEASQDTSTTVRLLKYAKAKKALEKIDAGTDFSDVAKAYSESPTAQFGGDLGRPVLRGELGSFPEVEKAAFELEKGKHSGIITSLYGYHIIEVEEKETGSLRSFDLVKNEIVEKLNKEHTQQRYKDWFNQVKSKFNIQTFPENY